MDISIALLFGPTASAMVHPEMSRLLITQLSVEGMRSLDNVELDLCTRADVTRGQDDACTAVPTVLIGLNGAGKSTIVEACELLRKVGSERPFVGKLFDVHGGPPALLRKTAKRLRIGVRLMAAKGIELTYSVSLRNVGTSLTVERETATLQEPKKAAELLLERAQSAYVLPHPEAPRVEHPVDADDLAPHGSGVRPAGAQGHSNCAAIDRSSHRGGRASTVDDGRRRGRPTSQQRRSARHPRRARRTQPAERLSRAAKSNTTRRDSCVRIWRAWSAGWKTIEG
jgi:hypothetical protein